MVSGPVKMLADRWKEVNTPSLLVHLEEGETSGSLDQRQVFASWSDFFFQIRFPSMCLYVLRMSFCPCVCLFLYLSV